MELSILSSILLASLHVVSSLLLFGLGLILMDGGSSSFSIYFGGALASYSCLSVVLLILTRIQPRIIFVSLVQYAVILLLCGLIIDISMIPDVKWRLFEGTAALLLGGQWFSIRYLVSQRGTA